MQYHRDTPQPPPSPPPPLPSSSPPPLSANKHSLMNHHPDICFDQVHKHTISAGWKSWSCRRVREATSLLLSRWNWADKATGSILKRSWNSIWDHLFPGPAPPQGSKWRQSLDVTQSHSLVLHSFGAEELKKIHLPTILDQNFRSHVWNSVPGTLFP